jgi:nucleotide-binding universal stress UspA family protein
MSARVSPRRRRAGQPFKCVLVATDFSTTAARAMARAARLPLAPRARLHIVHVVPPGLPARVRSSAEAEASRLVESSVWEARGITARRGLAITSEVLAGRPFIEIIRCARATEAELIVLGRHGKRRLRDAFVGTTAQRVVRMADVPVLVVRLPAAGPYRRPVLAIDLQDTSFRVAELALRVMDRSTKRCALVHAYHLPFEGFIFAGSASQPTAYHREIRDQARSRLRAFVERLDQRACRWRPVVRHGDPRLVLADELVRRRADLVVLGSHGRSGLSHALLGSVAEWVIACAPCDVLIARPARFSFELP